MLSDPAFGFVAVHGVVLGAGSLRAFAEMPAGAEADAGKIPPGGASWMVAVP